MKKYLVLLIYFICFSQLISIAQSFDIQEGVVQKTKSEPLKIIGLFQGQLISISKYKEQLYLVKYDQETLKPIDYKKLPLSYKSKTVEFINIIKINDSYFLITRFINKKSKEAYYLSQKIDMSILHIIGKPELWSNCYLPKSYKHSGFFMLSQSADKSKTVVLNSLNSDSDIENLIHIRVYGNDSTPLFQKDLEIPMNLLLTDILDVAVNNQGKVFFLGKRYFDVYQDVRNSKINYEYLLFEYSNTSDSLKEFHFDTKHKVIVQLRMAINKHQNTVCAAITYDEKADHRTKAETYIQKENSTVFESFSTQEINVYNPSGSLSKPQKKGIPTYHSQGIIPVNTKDRLVFLAEFRKHSETYGIPPGHVFTYMNNVALEIDSIGNIIENFETKKLQAMKGKRQTYPSLNDYHDPIWAGSYSYIFIEAYGNYYIAYNESSKNVEKEKWNTYYRGDEKKTIPFLVQLANNYENKYYRIINEEKDKVKLYTNAYFISDNILYLIVKKNGGQLALKITFKPSID